ncbi:MAG: carboxyltransferase domain-containing protein [Pseudomonadota bacterium]
MGIPLSLSPRIVPVGLSGMLVNFSDVLSEGANRAALAFRAKVDDAGLDGIVETSTSLTSTFIAYDPKAITQADLRDRLSALLVTENWATAALPANRRLWRIPAAFGGDQHGPQLAEAAALAGISPSKAMEEICATTLRVMTIGFAPGQPYLGSLPPNWDIPRQTGLTKAVPVGAITVAIRQIVLFSTTSPTGWRQVGQCAFRAFRPEAVHPFALTPGDEIRFETVSAEDMAAIRARNDGGLGGAVAEPLI